MHKLLICSSYKYEYNPISYSSQHFSMNYLSATCLHKKLGGSLCQNTNFKLNKW